VVTLYIVIYHTKYARTFTICNLAILRRYLIKGHLAVETMSHKFRSRQTGETKYPNNSRGQWNNHDLCGLYDITRSYTYR